MSKKSNQYYHHSIKIKWILRWHWSSLASGQITLISLMDLSFMCVSHKTVKTEERCVFSFIIPTINTTPVKRAIKVVISFIILKYILIFIVIKSNADWYKKSRCYKTRSVFFIIKLLHWVVYKSCRRLKFCFGIYLTSQNTGMCTLRLP